MKKKKTKKLKEQLKERTPILDKSILQDLKKTIKEELKDIENKIKVFSKIKACGGIVADLELRREKLKENLKVKKL